MCALCQFSPLRLRQIPFRVCADNEKQSIFNGQSHQRLDMGTLNGVAIHTLSTPINQTKATTTTI